MDYLQYIRFNKYDVVIKQCFKPCYKWITFNTFISIIKYIIFYQVLNLVINGLPSIPEKGYQVVELSEDLF